MSHKEALRIVIEQSRMIIEINENAENTGKEINWHDIAVGIIDGAEKLQKKC